MKKKVSIITPCYNGEDFVGRYLDSILNQTYPNMELILVNDGSTDSTENVVLSYKQKFTDRGFDFKYICQQNAGQASALNAGLKIFKGDYLTWPDSDNYLAPQSIEKRVEILERNKQYGFIRTDAYMYNERRPFDPFGYQMRGKDNRFNEEIFDDLILGKTGINGCYMVRTSAFWDVNPNKQIYCSRDSSSQNFQMLLPIAHKYKCGYIDEPLYNIVIRQKSYSRSFITKEGKLKRCKGHEDILNNIINSLDIDRKHYINIITEKWLHKKLVIAGHFRDKVLAEEYYSKLKDLGSINNRDKISYLMSRNIFINVAIRGLSEVRRTLSFVINRFSFLRILKNMILHNHPNRFS